MVGVLFAGLMLVGGCKTQQEYDELWRQNRAAQEELGKAMGELGKLRSDLQAKDRQIDELTQQNKALRDQIALLQTSNDQLQATLKDLRAQLANSGKEPTPPKMGFPLSDEVNKILQAIADKYPGMFTFDKKKGMLKMLTDTTFDPGSDVVNAEATKALGEFAKILNMPELSGLCCYVAGHTDDIRIVKDETKRRHPNNWYLSVHRAVAVEDILQKASVSPERLCAAGFGEFQPAAPNAAGHKGNKLNRRVEMWLVPAAKFMTVTGSKTEPAETPTETPDKTDAPSDK